MCSRYVAGSVGCGPESSLEAVRSPYGTYEGSRHYVAGIGNTAAQDEDPTSTKTVIMSAALLARLRTLMRGQARRDAPDLRSPG